VLSQKNNADLIIVSLLSHRDVMLYVIAIKSLYHFLQKGAVHVINDGSLTQRDINLLKKHVHNLLIFHIKDIPSLVCPKGGCWERLLFVADHNPQAYVLVLDADILTQHAIEEVKDAIANNASFIMGDGSDQKIVPMPDILAVMRRRYSNVDMATQPFQSLYDTTLDKIPDYETRLYLRGTGGFNGFARGSISRQRVEEFSQEMARVFGDDWKRWGSEQIAVCYLIANTPQSRILPCPKYALYYADKNINYAESSVLHFIGTHRFQNGFYIKQTRQFIQNVAKKKDK